MPKYLVSFNDNVIHICYPSLITVNIQWKIRFFHFPISDSVNMEKAISAQ